MKQAHDQLVYLVILKGHISYSALNIKIIATYICQ
jgi:hypothetical protein